MTKRNKSERNIFKLFTVILLTYIIVENAVRLFKDREFMADKLIYFVAALALIIICITFAFSARRIIVSHTEEDLVLDLDKGEGFTDRESIIICKILENEKYDYIARQLNLSEITVKKAAGTIFKKLDCSDKMDLFGKYANHAVTKGKDLYLSTDRTESELLKKLIKKEQGL